MGKTGYVLTEAESKQKSLELIKQVDETMKAYLDFLGDIGLHLIEEEEEMFEKLGLDLAKSLAEFRSNIISFQDFPKIPIDTADMYIDEQMKLIQKIIKP